ncbi:serine/threonine-protein phosphatase 6 regulatory ankyrin repeat subunit A-like isoform X1 [Leptotrombidium deliense]|uniref:Serine/threonine-protein phosphatase 6 regulatory ankyrin repeat subunit A-like isoform X1 n=1 Tax=Leptotrombidium deliense TaxID=299467 RepID=A0A443SNH1_9ACAR|nr:serine/threonine-protein phosphatase 6 regulatory ankyrin repeat subunit A-like isoform X1 [Leptotrombidium deliense]
MQHWNAASDLLVAIQYNDLSTAESILRRPHFDADIRFRLSANNSVPAICVCAERGLNEMMRLLIDSGCSVNLRDDCGFTPLHFAVTHQFVDIINLLLNQRANANCVSNYGHTPLHLAAQQSSLVVELLVKAGAKLNCRDCDGKTPLSFACIHNHTKIAKYLIDKGADVNCEDNYLNTPLLLAINSGLCLNAELIRYLLEANADPNHTNANGQSAMFTAIRRSSDHCLQGVDIVTALLENDCDIDVCDSSYYGENAVHLSISRNQDRITETLIRFGCNLNARNINGHSVLYRLLREGKQHLASMVLAAGIDWKFVLECRREHLLISALPDSPFRRIFHSRNGLFPKLKHLSRVKIRQTLGRNCDAIIKQLSLPNCIIHYLLLNELF